jgi:hypothetical protein
MILYNITVIIDEGIEREWLLWMQDIHIPEVMATGKFVSQRLLKVLESPNEGVTYCVQFVADSKALYDLYRVQSEQTFLSALQNKYPNKLVSFSTIMEFV